MKTVVLIGVSAVLFVNRAQAQTAQTEPKEGVRIERDVLKLTGPGEPMTFDRQVIGVAGAFGGPDVVEFVSAETSVAGKVVKGAAYSADAVTESTQTLSDGNRISKSSMATTYRDSEGRTRRDMTLPAIGPFATAGDAPSFVVINDPVAGVSYHLDSKNKTARKLPGGPGLFSYAPAAQGVKFARTRAVEVKGDVAVEKGASEKMATAEKMAVKGDVIALHGAGPQVQIHLNGGQEPKSESLGKQAIDGIEVEGTRSTVTIPAGEIGNERDIEIVNERWYSNELQTVIMSKHSDPRIGQTTYKLTNIKRGDPHPTLFQVPSDYKLIAEEAPMRFMRKLETKDKEE
jgi:hypothetical protein